MENIHEYKITNPKLIGELSIIKTYCNGFIKIYEDQTYKNVFKETRFVVSFFGVDLYDAFCDEELDMIVKTLIKGYVESINSKNNLNINDNLLTL